MKKFFLLSVAATLICSISFATIRRVGYTGVAKTGIDYTTTQLAHDACAIGDTIQIYGTQGSANISKRLVIMGFGYNFDVNPNLQVAGVGTDNPSAVNLNFNPGSDSSIAEGLTGSFIIGNQTNLPVGVGVNKVIIRRCNCTVGLHNQYAPVNDIKVINCLLSSDANSASIRMLYLTVNPCTNLQVYNCFFYGYIGMYLTGSSGSIINCTTMAPTLSFTGSGISFLNLNDAGFLVKNCIIRDYRTTSINTIYENNFFGTATPTVLPPGSNNRWGQVWANLFTRITTNDDASALTFTAFDEDYFILKPGSLAINGGFDALGNPTDCGIYGGEPVYRYKLSGVPAVPSIYKLTSTATSATANPYNITVSVRSNN